MRSVERNNRLIKGQVFLWEAPGRGWTCGTSTGPFFRGVRLRRSAVTAGTEPAPG